MLCNIMVYGQVHDRIIPLKFYINDSLIYNDSEVTFEFTSKLEMSRKNPSNGTITIPRFCFKYKYVQMKIIYRNYKAFATLYIETLLNNEFVYWSMGFDTRPFNKDRIAYLAIHPNDKLIFFWEAKLDEIIDIATHPIRDNIFDYLFEIEEEEEVNDEEE